MKGCQRYYSKIDQSPVIKGVILLFFKICYTTSLAYIKFSNYDTYQDHICDGNQYTKDLISPEPTRLNDTNNIRLDRVVIEYTLVLIPQHIECCVIKHFIGLYWGLCHQCVVYIRDCVCWESSYFYNFDLVWVPLSNQIPVDLEEVDVEQKQVK